MARIDIIDLTGKRFGRWTVLKRDPQNYYHITPHPDGSKTYSSMPRWICKCDCGTVKTVIGANLRNGLSRSCGCITRERMKARHAEARKKKEEAYAKV